MYVTRRDFIKTVAISAASLPAGALLQGCGDNTQRQFSGYDATGLAQLVRTREVSAVELLDDTIRRIEAVNPKLNAIIAKSYDRARSRAATVGAGGLPLRGPLPAYPG